MKLEESIEQDFEQLKLDLKIADMKLEKLQGIPNIDDVQNIVASIYATAIMKAYSNYFNVKTNYDIKKQ